ncbi:TlpA family protein disulfide reductase [Hymenobacter sp. 15J16-1T3B]|uniref:TlpA family protein disulfide reductase n=1 Tax=Hymenobacter sp. 15J16-1T3B TaxID=2886941 RepID=UPI001D0F652E|nr:TlpA disulfide reductase family protein [Hymenobacter sp. 15J16-1T3B]MCC3157849.1 TlpA family protein disulfide reductase [Hymenobacter sp. 15J16-1T3B]
MKFCLRAQPAHWLLGLLLLLGSAARAAAPLPTVVTGHIEHPASRRVALFLGNHPVTRRPLRAVWGELDEANNFRLEVPDLPFGQQAEFVHGGETAELYLTPGDELHLALDAEQFDETLTYTGRGANANNYLAQRFLRFYDFPLPSGPPPARDQAAPRSWRTPEQDQRLSDSLQQGEHAFLRSYAAEHPLPADFERFARTSIAYASAAGNLWYPYLKRRKEQNPDWPTPPGYYERLRQLPSLDSAMRQHSAEWATLLECYLSTVLYNSPRPVTAKELPAQLTAHFGSSRTRDVVMAQYCVYVLQSQKLTAAQPFVAALQQMTRDTLLVNPVQRLYARKYKLSGGRPAPDFTVRDATGKPVRLSDFRGKVVYLDFWASWCAPCLQEMPASAALREKYAKQDVVFLYVSVDTKEPAWKGALAKPLLTGPNARHGWAQGFETPAAKAYSIESIPAYFIIDRQGQLRGSAAPRPSAGQATIDALNEALAK